MINNRAPLVLGILLCLTISANSLAEADLSVLPTSSDGVAPGKLLELNLKQDVYQQLDARRTALGEIKSRAECEKWKKERREFFVKQLGGFPERTPLNARVVRRLNGDGYRVENVIFESRPGHRVTANLYLPESDGPYPGVLIPCRHSHNGKASGGYQRASILMARNGMAAQCYDPIGQGERYQMLDFEHDHEHFASVSYPLKVPHPRVRYLCTTEHTAMGIGCILLGANIAQYRIWDGMRAIDYLQSRDDIMADRIGCTGNSGGGTLTAYLIGRSYVGLRTDDVVAWAGFLKNFRADGDRPRSAIHVVGIDEAAIPTLHAAALQPELFKSVHLQNMIRSWAEVVTAAENHNQAANAVHGARRHYDLPDLIRLAGVEKVTVEKPVNAPGKPVSGQQPVSSVTKETRWKNRNGYHGNVLLARIRWSKPNRRPLWESL